VRRALALALVAALLVACDGGNENRATPSMTATVAATESVSATREPTRTPAPTATRPPVFRDQQVVVFELATREFTPLLPPHTDEEGLYFAYRFLPQFTPDGEHVWVAERSSGTAHRYNLTGEVTDSLRGFVIDETESGALAYMDTTSEGWVPTVRDGNEVYALPEVGNRGLIGIAPDGSKVAYWTDGPGEAVTVEVMEVATREVLARAEEVGLCQCDGGRDFEWSPSGRFLVYSDVHSPLDNLDDPEAGMFALDTVTGARTFFAPRGWGSAVSWISEDEHILGQQGNRLVELDLVTGEVVREIGTIPPGGYVRSAGRTAAIVDLEGDPLGPRTRSVSISSGTIGSDQLGELRPIPVGDAVLSTLELDGSTYFLNPLLDERFPFSGDIRVAPDARHFAVSEGTSVRIYAIESRRPVEIAVYEDAELHQWGITPIAVEWNTQGTHLLISVGFGL